MDAADRIKERIKEAGKSVRRVEIDLDLSNGYINKLNSDTVPYDKIKKIADYLGTSIDYLLYGKDGKIEMQIETYDRLDCERRLIRRLADLSDAQVKLMLDMISQMTGKDYGDR